MIIKMHTVYTCPMHPEVRRDRRGMCPEGGMTLVPGKAEGPDKSRFAEANRGSSISQAKSGHAGHRTAKFFRKFWVSLALTILVVLYADVVEKIFKWSLPDFYG